MIEEQLESLRKEYIAIRPSTYLIQNGWPDLEQKLQSGKVTFAPFFLNQGIVLAGIVLLITSAILGVSQISGPADALYPVKIASDKIISQITGNYKANIEKRAQEVINSSADPEDNSDEANRQYQQTLEEAKKEAEKKGRDEEFRNTLDQQEEKFRQVQRESPSSGKGLEEAIWYTQQVKGQVKGQNDEKTPGNNNQGSPNGKGK